MKNYFLLLAVSVIICSCIGGPKPPKPPKPFTVKIINSANFDIEFIDEKRLVPRGSERVIEIAEPPEDINGGYKIYYRLPLLDELYLAVPRRENVIISHKQDTPVEIKTADFVLEESFLIIHNNSKQTITLNLDSGGTVYVFPIAEFQPGRKWRGSPYIEGGGKGLYENIASRGNHFLIETDLYKRIPFTLDTSKPSYIYTYSFDGSAVALVDERPLRRIGESSWAKTIAEADGLIWPAPGTEQTGFFVPAAQGLFRHDYDSAGSGGAPVFSGERFEIAYAGRAGNGFMLAGYAKTGDLYRPVARIQGEDGAARAELAPSTRIDRYSAYYLAAAESGAETWLLAGGADSGINRPDGYRPYLRLVRRDSGGLVPVWELGGDEFTAQPSGKQCRPATAAAYDPAHGRWLVAGNTLEWDAYGNFLSNSWLAIISAAGTIQKIDLSFKGMTINKIITGPDGAYYLAGEERKGNESRAFCVKYANSGAELWRLAAQPPPYSYFQDAVLDREHRRLVLAGTLRAADPSGQGGVPFTLGLDPETGGLLWREELPALNGTAVVTAIAPAPDYGYVLALAGIGDNNSTRPFGIARINSRGKMIITKEQ
ncbi:MAG: hypothetical protein LBD55_02300 [Treponema sp.]|nr:hypothetical protein [Treponema sp.]